MSIQCSFTWHCLYLYFAFLNDLYISSHCCDIEGGSLLFSSNLSNNLRQPFHPPASCSCNLVSSFSFCIIQWLCSCANTVGRKFARPFRYCLTIHQRNAYFSGEGCWGPCIIFDISFGEEKRLCLERVFGFELLNAYVWVFFLVLNSHG